MKYHTAVKPPVIDEVGLLCGVSHVLLFTSSQKQTVFTVTQ